MRSIPRPPRVEDRRAPVPGDTRRRRRAGWRLLVIGGAAHPRARGTGACSRSRRRARPRRRRASRRAVGRGGCGTGSAGVAGVLLAGGADSSGAAAERHPRPDRRRRCGRRGGAFARGRSCRAGSREVGAGGRCQIGDERAHLVRGGGRARRNRERRDRVARPLDRERAREVLEPRPRRAGVLARARTAGTRARCARRRRRR